MAEPRPVAASRGLPGTRRPTLPTPLVVLAVLVLSCLVILAVIRPFVAGPAAADAASSILYWQRLVTGHRLEAFVNTTPKPLMTVVYGIAYGLTGDYRSVSAIAILSAAAAATLGAWLAARVAGATAAVLAWIFLVVNAQLLVEVAWAYGLPAAVALLAAAGLAVTAGRPRYGLAGLFLLLGALVRVEVFAVIGATTAATVLLAATGRLPRGAWRLLLAWLALPIMLAHDLLLAGDPLYWLRVSSVNVEGRSMPPASRALRRLVAIPLDNIPLAIAAIVGVVGGAWTRAGRIVVGGSVVLAVGTAALIMVVAVQHRLILGHYYTPILIAAGYLAALGGGFAVQRLRATWNGRRSAAARPDAPAGQANAPSEPAPWWATAAALLAAVAVAILAVWSQRASTGTFAVIDTQRAIAEHADAAAPVLSRLVASVDTSAPPVGPYGRPPVASYRVLISTSAWYRMTVTLGLQMTVAGRLDARTAVAVPPGAIAYVDPAADATGIAPAPFRGPSPATVGARQYTLVDGAPGGVTIWRASR